jgi:PAS domain S-box-containing protein
VFILVVLTIAGFIKLIHTNNADAGRRAQMVIRTNEITQTLEDVTSTLGQNEAAANDYILTGTPVLLKEAEKAAARIPQNLRKAAYLIKDSVQSKNLSVLTTLIVEKLNFQKNFTASGNIETGITARANYNAEARARDNAINHTMGILMARQSVLLQQRILDSEAANTRSQQTVFTGTAILFLFITLILFRLNSDIIRRKKAEDDIRNSEKKYRLLIEDAGVTIFTSDFSGKFTYVSAKCRALTGYTSEELTGQSFEMLVERDWISVVADEYVDQVRKLWEETTIEFPISTKSGQTKWVEQHAVLIFDEHKSPIGYQCIVRDITERRNHEGKLRRIEPVALAHG